jgi:hypothetical protein
VAAVRKSLNGDDAGKTGPDDPRLDVLDFTQVVPFSLEAKVSPGYKLPCRRCQDKQWSTFAEGDLRMWSMPIAELWGISWLYWYQPLLLVLLIVLLVAWKMYRSKQL